MQITLPFISCLILLASCNRYQYATINSQGLAMNDKQEFVAENDTLKLIYNFNGQDAPINLTIENKLNVPVYIDWRQSSLIVNNKAVSYVPDYMPVSGVISTAGYRSTSYTSSSGTIDAKVAVPPVVDFIPPHSYIIKNPMGVTNRSVILPDSTVHREKIVHPDGTYYTIKRATFTEASSPLRFRSYLTVAVGEADGKPVVYEHVFYVSELVNSGLGPENFGNSIFKGNRYYVRETTGFGRAATGFGVIAGTAVIVGAAAAINPNGNSDCNNCKY
jgi:hypothetical protein